MIIEELCKQYNVDTTTIPTGILNIQLGDNPLTYYTNMKKEKGKIIFTGKTGNADNELIINLKNINQEAVSSLELFLYEDEELPNDFPFDKFKEFLFEPTVISKTITPHRNFIINYNMMGKEVSRV